MTSVRDSLIAAIQEQRAKEARKAPKQSITPAPAALAQRQLPVLSALYRPGLVDLLKRGVPLHPNSVALPPRRTTEIGEIVRAKFGHTNNDRKEEYLAEAPVDRQEVNQVVREHFGEHEHAGYAGIGNRYVNHNG